MNVANGREPVLVGVSRAPAAVWAVRWAAGQAADRGLPLQVERQVLTGSPGHLLGEVAQRARCLVVGSHGHSGRHGALQPSTTASLVHHTHGPLVVVPPQFLAAQHEGSAR